MTDYTEQVAYHYSAYRPPLHQRILQEVHAVRFHEPEFLKVSDARRVEADMAFRSMEMVHLLFSNHQRFVALDCSEEAPEARLEEGDFAGPLPVRLYWSTYTVA